MKTFKEAIDEVTPQQLLAAGREWRDEVMQNDKFVTLVSMMGAQLMEYLCANIGAVKEQGAQKAAEETAVDTMSTLSVAFVTGMVVGMRMMQGGSNVSVQ